MTQGKKRFIPKVVLAGHDLGVSTFYIEKYAKLDICRHQHLAPRHAQLQPHRI